MKSAVEVSKNASTDIEGYLRGLDNTVDVKNVEGDAYYQGYDIDLIWIVRNVRRPAVTIEVKGDRWHSTGNFFFETFSNKERGTPGCFMYTEADYLFYYFVITHTLYVIPMPEARKWFCENFDEFKEKETTTPVGNGQHYTTVGRLVPIQRVIESIKGAEKIELNISEKPIS